MNAQNEIQVPNTHLSSEVRAQRRKTRILRNAAVLTLSALVFLAAVIYNRDQTRLKDAEADLQLLAQRIMAYQSAHRELPMDISAVPTNGLHFGIQAYELVTPRVLRIAEQLPDAYVIAYSHEIIQYLSRNRQGVIVKEGSAYRVELMLPEEVSNRVLRQQDRAMKQFQD